MRRILGIIAAALACALLLSSCNDYGVSAPNALSTSATLTDGASAEPVKPSEDTESSKSEAATDVGGDVTVVPQYNVSSDTTAAQHEEAPDDNVQTTPEATQTSPVQTTPSEAYTQAEQTKAPDTSTQSPSTATLPETEAPRTEAVKTGKLSVVLTEGSSWTDSGKRVVQYDGTVTNNTGSAVSSWNVSVNVPADSEIIGSWSGVFSINNGEMKISNENYNGEIPVGGTATFGVQLKSSSDEGITGGSASGSTAPVQTNQNNNNNNNNNNNPTAPATPPAAYTPSDKNAVQGDDWLSVEGNKIVDKDGKEVWLTGVNWFGYNTGTNTFDGLWACDLRTSVQEIANHGFNLLRIPISTELCLQWKNGIYPSANFNQATNSYLLGMNSLEIFDYVIDLCQSVGIKIMPDIHCAKTDSMGHMYPVWYNGSITAEDYYTALEFLADRYKNNDTIIAYDLKNEPHGKPNESPRAIWNDSNDENNWKHIAETAAARVLAKNPNVLIMVEGIEIYPIDLKKNSDYHSQSSADYYYCWWGGNLRGVKDYPVNLGKYQNKLVYSPHDYGPAVYKQPWFYNGYDYDSLIKDCWQDNWLYIHTGNTAPLLIGEWGGYMTEPNLTWMTHMRTLIKKYKLHHTFWCFNANSGDTGGLVKDDFTTWDSEKYTFVKEALWQSGGKFVGLDHEIPLGTNGISLSEYK